MGTTLYCIALDRVPELNDKFYSGILLAPAGFVSRTTSPFRALGSLMEAVPNVIIRIIYLKRFYCSILYFAGLKMPI